VRDHKFPLQCAVGQRGEADRPFLSGKGRAEGIPCAVQRDLLAQEVLESLVIERNVADRNADEHDMAAGSSQARCEIDRSGNAGRFDDQVTR
jgi:hypothetical protein